MTDQQTQGQGTAAPQTAESAAGQGQQKAPESQPQETVEQFLERTGFKSLEDAAKSYKEAQAKITKQGQQLAQLESALQGNYAQGGSQVYRPPAQVAGQGADFFDDPEGHVARLARQIASEEVTGAVQQLEAKQSIARVRGENPARFDALRPIAQQIYVEKPYLNSLGEDGLRQAMEEAAGRRQQYLADLKAEMFPDQQTNNQQDVRSQAKQEVLAEQERARNAMIPQDGANRAITSDERQKHADLIQKGDIDGLMDFKMQYLKP